MNVFIFLGLTIDKYSFNSIWGGSYFTIGLHNIENLVAGFFMLLAYFKKLTWIDFLE